MRKLMVAAAVASTMFGTAWAHDPGFDEVTGEQERAIQRGLDYLARTQAPNGSWGANGSTGHRVACSALAGLAFLAHGDTPTQGKYAMNLRKAIRYLTNAADPSGLIADAAGGNSPMHEHGYAMLFLGQVYGMCANPSENEKIKTVLIRGAKLSARSQSAAGGWLYTPDANSQEASVTITQVEGLRAAMDVGVMVDKRVISRAIDLIKNSQNSDGSVNYSVGRGAGGGSVALTAAGVSVVFNAGQFNPETNKIKELGLKHLERSLKASSVTSMTGHFFYTHFYMVQATYLAGGSYWRMYFPQIRKHLLGSQRGDGSWSGGVGQSFDTAVGCIILQVPYRFLPILQK